MIKDREPCLSQSAGECAILDVTSKLWVFRVPHALVDAGVMMNIQFLALPATASVLGMPSL